MVCFGGNQKAIDKTGGCPRLLDGGDEHGSIHICRNDVYRLRQFGGFTDKVIPPRFYFLNYRCIFIL